MRSGQVVKDTCGHSQRGRGLVEVTVEDCPVGEDRLAKLASEGVACPPPLRAIGVHIRFGALGFTKGRALLPAIGPNSAERARASKQPRDAPVGRRAEWVGHHDAAPGEPILEVLAEQEVAPRLDRGGENDRVEYLQTMSVA